MKCKTLSYSQDDFDDRLADWNQMLLCRCRTKLLREESGVSPGQTEGDEWFNTADDVVSYNVSVNPLLKCFHNVCCSAFSACLTSMKTISDS